jgi:hypothetical protein
MFSNEDSFSGAPKPRPKDRKHEGGLATLGPDQVVWSTAKLHLEKSPKGGSISETMEWAGGIGYLVNN